ncbi:MAG: 50S ribosomal protein L17 [Patescibacteria group bacterium]
MRHRIFGRRLNRTHNQRQALFRSLLRSLFTHGAVTTTAAKAKSISNSAEKIATLAVKNNLTSFRRINKIFNNRQFVAELITRINTTFTDQNSNFFRFDNVGYRQGDNSLQVKLSLTKAYSKLEEKKTKKKVTKEEAK